MLPNAILQEFVLTGLKVNHLPGNCPYFLKMGNLFEVVWLDLKNLDLNVNPNYIISCWNPKVNRQDDLSSNFSKLWLCLDTGTLTDLCKKSRSCWNKSGSSMSPWACYNCTCRKWVRENTFPVMVLAPVPGLSQAELCRAGQISHCPRAQVWMLRIGPCTPHHSGRAWGADRPGRKIKRQWPVLHLLLSHPRALVRSPRTKFCSLPLAAEAEAPFLKEQERLGIFAASNGSSPMLMICSVAIVWAFNK